MLHRLFCFIILLCILSSCSKTVYVNQLGSSKSKFILYKHRFKYEEKTSIDDIKARGSYKLNDSTISFTFDHIKTTPYSYISQKTNKLEKSNQSHIKLYLAQEIDNEPILGAAILLKNKNHETINILVTDFDGMVEIKKDDSIYQIEIISTGHSNSVIKAEDFLNYDLKIFLENLNYKGANSDGTCIAQAADPILVYRIDNSNDIKVISKDDILFEKVLD
ncbi:MAG: hypothetical protein ACSHWW_11925 [Nonlabens sp.]|uniref:hypothetical protein n=1 Tax=Nonlabens sp. TaxID=1888209 RepID=UPI003EF2B447